jgi:hypothetical protein
VSGADPAPINPKFSEAHRSAARLHNLFFSTATFGMLAMPDAGLLIQQIREEQQVIIEFCDDAEDQLEKNGKVIWSVKPDC